MEQAITLMALMIAFLVMPRVVVAAVISFVLVSSNRSTFTDIYWFWVFFLVIAPFAFILDIRQHHLAVIGGYAMRKENKKT